MTDRVVNGYLVDAPRSSEAHYRGIDREPWAKICASASLPALVSYAGGVSSLGGLIAELDHLSAQLDHSCDDFRSAYHRHWTVLEQVYAAALDRQLPDLDEATERLVKQSIASLRILLAQRLEDSQARTYSYLAGSSAIDDRDENGR